MEGQRLDLDNDPGFFLFKLNGDEKKLDTFEQNNIIYDLHKANDGNVIEQQKAISRHLGTLFGIEPPSTAIAVRFMEFVQTIVEDVRKKLVGLPASPTTTPVQAIPSSSNAGSEQPSC